MIMDSCNVQDKYDVIKREISTLKIELWNFFEGFIYMKEVARGGGHLRISSYGDVSLWGPPFSAPKITPLMKFFAKSPQITVLYNLFVLADILYSFYQNILWHTPVPKKKKKSPVPLPCNKSAPPPPPPRFSLSAEFIHSKLKTFYFFTIFVNLTSSI